MQLSNQASQLALVFKVAKITVAQLRNQQLLVPSALAALQVLHQVQVLQLAQAVQPKHQAFHPHNKLVLAVRLNVTGMVLTTQVVPTLLMVGAMRTAKAVSLNQLALLNQHLTV